MRSRQLLLYVIVASLAVAVPMTGPASAVTPDVHWHPTFGAAQARAAESGKPILVFGYSPDDRHCRTLITSILTQPDVVRELGKFELFAANADDPALKQFCATFGIGVVDQTDTWITQFPVLPIFLFLEGNAHEYFRHYGYTPTRRGSQRSRDLAIAGAAFALRLEKIGRLIGGLRQIATEPTATAYAEVGHILIELEHFDDARPHLQKAVQLDPTNETGAFADAYLDLIILDIAEDPARALQQLDDFATRYAESDRLLEVRYYRGVCLLALEKYKEARTVLCTFETNDRSAPEFDSPWTPLALGLLQQLDNLKLGL